MKCRIIPMLLLILTVEHSAGNRFLISAPNVFHIGVKEKVFVQMEAANPVTLYLEHETTQTIVSEKETIDCAEGKSQTVELMINMENWSKLPKQKERAYLLVVAESPSFTGRQQTRVLVSPHRGYIFIQTDQPMYNPTNKVKYRIFTLDHTMRPHEEQFQISALNPAGNRVMKSFRTAKGGIFRGELFIPRISKLGTWKITAHYQGDETNAVSREFKVEKFVLPSFDVNIEMDQAYILLDAEELTFNISARYTHGEKVKGAYHCRFGVIQKATTHGQTMEPVMIKGLELTGSILHGAAEASLKSEKINLKIRDRLNKTLSDLQKSEAQLYLGVFVTNIQSGELQEAEVYLPIVSHKYTVDLSRTRSYFLAGYPIDVVVFVHLPNGSPASDVSVTINVQVGSEDISWQGLTNAEGAVFPSFNTVDVANITIEVSTNGLRQRQTIRRASSPSNSYLHMTFTYKMYSVNDLLQVLFHTINAPSEGYIYYMVLSRGRVVEKDSLRLGTSVKRFIQITHDMVPFFRLIAYYHNAGGDIIADSAWIDVRDECEIKVTVKQNREFTPGEMSELELDLHGQRAKMALLAVDKAFYALNADNKLTAKQVFTAMKSYDLGCSYGGGADSASVLSDAGLAFVSKSKSGWRKGFACNSPPARQRRSVDLQQEMMTLKSNFIDTNVQDCCVEGFSLIPMRRTCRERVVRVQLVTKNQTCADAFLKCCLEAERLRQRKTLEDSQQGLGRTTTSEKIENLILNSDRQTIRRFFPPSFEFKEFEVNGKKSFSFFLPHSITTWEFQFITLSQATGFCVVKPTEVKAFKSTFVSLRLPYSVKQYEQLSISPVIYNYNRSRRLQLAVHMEQTEGLCSPGSATSTSYVNITLEPQSSQHVFFSAVPMVTGSIPIKIHLFDREHLSAKDAIEKTLRVQTEGVEYKEEETHVFRLDGKTPQSIKIDRSLPDETVPDSNPTILVSVEGGGFDKSSAKNLLSPEKVANLIALPTGCLEQTMKNLVPTALALRYLDLSEQWFDLPPGTRDDALNKIEQGYTRIFTMHTKKSDGSYGTWYSVPSSNWVTALLVKVLSMVLERQTAAIGQQRGNSVPLNEIRQPAGYLLSIQSTDGSFTDPNPVLHRGIMNRKDQDASMTAFISLALFRSIQFLSDEQQKDVKASMARSTAYLLSELEELQHPYAIAITAYCLSVCQPNEADRSPGWTKLHKEAIKAENGCYLWSTDRSPENQKKADALTVETTAYALLAAVELGHTKWADEIACWLTSQENYFGGYRSTQDTIMALEALTEYALKRSITPEVNLIAEFTVPGRNDIVKLELGNNKERVETDLKKLKGNNIVVQLTGKGEAKFKVMKAYHLLEPKNYCDKLSIRVTVEGKVKYTAKVIENYDYYDYDTNQEKQEEVPQSAIEWSDARSRSRRDVDNNQNSNEVVTYTVCVGYSQNSSLTGMTIADITLLSGFEAVTDNLDRLKLLPEQYITSYEVSYGRVLLYFNKLFNKKECVSFDAVQIVPIGLLQPAPAVFYDYYEPNRKCTVFYSAPRRSKMVSKLCSSEDVCQCAERPCHKLSDTFKIKYVRGETNERELHACFFPRVDYVYIVEVVGVSEKSNFKLYSTNVMEVLRSNGDVLVNKNSVRVFAKRLQCKGQLDVGKQYLIMGKDGSTTDSSGEMQYLLESNTWVEKSPSEEECTKSGNKNPCYGLKKFTSDYKTDGCRQ